MAAANTSVAREYHAGLAATLGIQAALAAQRGYRAEESILETRNGFFEVYGGVNATVAGDGVMRDIGQSWDIITDMAIKLAPGGHPYHALAEAAANVAKAADIEPEAIESITVSRPGLTALTGPLHPSDLIGMAHSPAYFLAAGAANRDFSWIHATADKISDPVIHQLTDKIRVGAPPTDDLGRYRQGATVTIQTKDGRSSTSTVFEPRGAAARGIAWDDVDTKYRTLVPQAGVPGRQIEASLAIIHRFRDVNHVSKLIDLLQV
jgi:2-methylcitrate dehydratase PrpD